MNSLNSKFLSSQILQLPTSVSPAAARNRGIKIAKGRYIGFLDDDIILPQKYFEILNSILEEDHPDILGGPEFLNPNPSSIQMAYSFCQSEPFITGHTSKRHKYLKEKNKNANEGDLILCHLWFKAEILRENKFPEHFLRNEENVLLDTLSQKNFCSISHPDLFVFHFKKNNLRKVIKANYESGYFRMRSFFELKKIKWIFLVPAFFVIYLLILCASLGLEINQDFILHPIRIYIILVILHTLKSVNSFPHWSIQLWVFFMIPLTHISYGVGLLNGIINTKGIRKS